MLPGLFFTFWRGAQILTLIPTVGMLSWFVHGFVQNNELMPNLVLVLFIVSVLALVWALATVIFYTFTKHNALFVAFIELCFVGAFIAGVYELRSIAHSNCAHFDTTDDVVYLSLGPFGAISSNVRFPYPSFAKNCSMLKACFAFGIMECIFFFFTFLIALWIRQKHRDYYVDNRRGSRDVYVERRTTTRRSGSRGYDNRGYASSPRRSHHSRRSSHSRAYV